MDRGTTREDEFRLDGKQSMSVPKTSMYIRCHILCFSVVSLGVYGHRVSALHCYPLLHQNEPSSIIIMTTTKFMQIAAKPLQRRTNRNTFSHWIAAVYKDVSHWIHWGNQELSVLLTIQWPKCQRGNRSVYYHLVARNLMTLFAFRSHPTHSVCLFACLPVCLSFCLSHVSLNTLWSIHHNS